MPFLFFLGLLATSAAVGSLVDLNGGDTSQDDPESDAVKDDAQDEASSNETAEENDAPDHGWVFGEDGVNETLSGTEGDDSIAGNAQDGDRLEGGAGDDTLWVGAENTANGGAGADTIIVQADGADMGVVEEFVAGVDTLVVRDFENPIDGSSGGLILTQEDDGLALRNAENGAVHLALPGADLVEGEALSILFQETDGAAYNSEVLHESLRSFTVTEAPFVTDALRGTEDADTLVGDSGNNVIFGESGADHLQGGEGDDHIYSGSGSIYYGSEWHHAPGHLDKLGVNDTLDGGAGEDTLWLGSGNEATGGNGQDEFRAFAGVYDEATEITDFAAGEDRIVVNFGLDGAFGASFQNAENDYYSVEEAASAFDLSFDADANQTTVSLGGHPLLILNGDQSGVTVAFSNQDFADNYGDAEDYQWLDANGDPISETAALSADILFSGMTPQDMYDANGNGGLAA